jgi:hypothetical protein
VLEVTALGWGTLIAVVVAFLALDVVVSARRARPSALRGAAVWSIL